jgi:hypothetical protein
MLTYEMWPGGPPRCDIAVTYCINIGRGAWSSQYEGMKVTSGHHASLLFTYAIISTIDFFLVIPCDITLGIEAL